MNQVKDPGGSVGKYETAQIPFVDVQTSLFQNGCIASFLGLPIDLICPANKAIVELATATFNGCNKYKKFTMADSTNQIKTGGIRSIRVAELSM